MLVGRFETINSGVRELLRMRLAAITGNYGAGPGKVRGAAGR